MKSNNSLEILSAQQDPSYNVFVSRVRSITENISGQSGQGSAPFPLSKTTVTIQRHNATALQRLNIMLQ